MMLYLYSENELKYETLEKESKVFVQKSINFQM